MRSFVHALPGGATATVHLARYPLAAWHPRVARVDPPQALAAWCAERGAREALVGGFFARPGAEPLGELWVGGRRLPSIAFDGRRGRARSCLSVEPGRVAIAPRRELPRRPAGDLLQAGPLLVAAGEPVVGADPEGFSSGMGQFDSDITAGRYPRAAVALAGETLLALACDGRATGDAGMTLAELARLLADLGARAALNLDGGGSTTLVSRGRLVNTPREEHGIALVGGRPVSTAIVFEPRR